jgi:chorismate lyase/3-hydroxybenzoate synthase
LGQLDETLANLSALLESLPGERAIDGLGLLKVYLRHPEHYAAARDALRQSPWGALPALYLRADICRRELLIEIEAVG